MLLPHQVRPFLLHEDPIVRDHALEYFDGASDFGQATAEDSWAAVERFGETPEMLHFARRQIVLPQTDASVQSLLDALARNPAERFADGYQNMARKMPLDTVQRRREELLGSPHLTDDVKAYLRRRLELLDQSAMDAWDRLMQHGRDLVDACAGDFDVDESQSLVEAAARGGGQVAELALLILRDPTSLHDWRAIFAVQVLGAVRYEPALDALVNLLGVESDLLPSEANRALARIGSLQVIERIVSFYPGKSFDVRATGFEALDKIKRPESEAALLKLLELERSRSQDPDQYGGELMQEIFMLGGLTDLCSMHALEDARRLLQDMPTDPDVFDVCERALAVAIMHGITLPEEGEWRKQSEQASQRREAAFAEMKDRWGDDDENPFSGSNDAFDDDEDGGPIYSTVTRRESDDNYGKRLKPFRNIAPKIGRNDPCPCGSGKKYKKCCGKV